jgi:hypothetical protein
MAKDPGPRDKAVIASLAILKVNSDHGSDYIDIFVPFIAECLKNSATDVVSLSELQAQLRSQHGLEVPQAALRSMLDRAVRAGYAERDNHLYRRKLPALQGLEFEATRGRAMREVTALVDRLVAYSAELLPSTWVQRDAESALLQYLASRGTSLLASSSGDIPLALPEGSVPNAEYVLASFVQRLRESDPNGFDYLVTAVKGSVLASVLYFENIGQVSRRFDHLAIYLDTVVLVHALGLVGSDYEVSANEMLVLSRELGANLNCFQDTMREVEGILGFAANYIRSGRPPHIPIWGVTEFLVRTGKTASDIELLSAHLVERVMNLGINVRERPLHVVAHTVDEPAFAKQLKVAIKYRAPEPLQHDLDAITAIHRLRGGQPMPAIETCRAIFITTNSPLARATTRFFREVYDSSSFAPLAMPAHQFGTLAWLKKPQVAPELPTKFLISDALAVLNPGESLWREYVQEIAKLEAEGRISADDCQLLRYSPAAKVALMGVTIGGSRAYLEGSVPAILERVRAAERRDAEAEAARERTLREEVQARAATDREEQDRTHQLELAQISADLERERHGALTAAERRRARYRMAGRGVALAFRVALLIGFGALAVMGVFAATGVGDLGAFARGITANPIVAWALVLVGIGGVALTATGDGLITLVRPIESRIQGKVERVLATAFDPPPAPGADDDGDAAGR